MTSDALPIISCGGIDLPSEDSQELRNLKPLLSEALDKPPRRLSRFIQLAMIAAARCVGDRELPPDTDICLTSGSGDFDVTFDVLNRVFKDKLAPKPLSFINTVSNAACFYLTRLFALHGASTFVSRRCFAMEIAFNRALQDARSFKRTSFLIGGVDILTVPLDIHAERLGVPHDTELAEGSHWFLLGDIGTDSRIGWLEAVRYFPDVETAADWISNQEDMKPDVVARGFWLSDRDHTTLLAAAGACSYECRSTPSGFYETTSGFTISDFLQREDFTATRLLHAQADEDGLICLMSFRRD